MYYILLIHHWVPTEIQFRCKNAQTSSHKRLNFFVFQDDDDRNFSYNSWLCQTNFLLLQAILIPEIEIDTMGVSLLTEMPME
jgi:hypothetical protein